MALSPEEILLRWFNYHLEQAGHHRRVHNFSDDIKVIYHNLHRTFLWHLSTVLPENLMSVDEICSKRYTSRIVSLDSELRRNSNLL